MRSLIAVLLVAASAPAAAAAPLPDWKVMADCAAAYRANAAVPDPDRAPSMKAQISDTAADYVRAAVRRNRQQTHASAARARRTVDATLRARAAAYAAQPREAVEHVIDACPQPEGSPPG